MLSAGAFPSRSAPALTRSPHAQGLDEFPSDKRINGTLYANDQCVLVATSSRSSASLTLGFPFVLRSARREFTWGRLTFHNRTHMSYELIASRNSSVAETWTLYKAHGETDDGHGSRGKKWCGRLKC